MKVLFEDEPSPVATHEEEDDRDDSSGMGLQEDDDNESGVLTRERIAQRESQAVFYLRLMVMAVLVASAAAVVVVTYLYMSGAEQDEFEQRFHSDADKVLESVGKTWDQVLGATDVFVLQLVAYARVSNSTWPFINMPNYNLHAGKLLKLSKAFVALTGVFVEPEQRDDWELFASQNLDWIEEGKRIQEIDPDWNKPTDFNNTIHYKLWAFEGQTVGEPQPYLNNYLPLWQQHPIIPEFGQQPMAVNWDAWFLPAASKGIEAAAKNQVAALVPAGNIAMNQSNDFEVFFKKYADTFTEQYVDLKEGEAIGPVGTMAYPIIDSLDAIRLNRTQLDSNKVVGMQLFFFRWRNMLVGLLPSDSQGIVVVVTNPCKYPFTFQLDGNDVIYLGPGDLHDTQFDDNPLLSQHVSLFDIMQSTKESEDGSAYTGVPLSTSYCPQTIHIYPSQSMQDKYVTTDPLVFTLVALSIFLFTSTLFLVYDCIVARRQRIVMEQAIASGAIVSSLFPEKVKNQLYKEQKQEHKKEQSMMHFLQNRDDDDQDGVAPGSSKPLADLFHNTTIFMADLAGFTAWSSKRTPCEVFEMLEALYGSFDKIARQRKVFKVETIGDSYVAVTGIPEPQAQHAAIMVRFAQDCIAKMRIVTKELAEHFGEDTMDLEMRVGLNSGSTTAGVLRGEKGRFQLFGDTINVASRMESNGVKGRIHVSQATADALIAVGKGHWLTPRVDKIVAKGKGEMQTYLVDVSPSKALSSGGTSTISRSSNSGARSKEEGVLAARPPKESRTGNTLNLDFKAEMWV
ncbi:Receptor-type guanylate cyclase gcy [Seminavis robusta]|uniref:Receptor-type guanylate cyclase gcy n=1 Tax=Seminavis robusta TaxID=568900 RepID=A0A9N8HR00_9STRA|nr:Receptor-type guanylate cyclase gcy [Seminavis robusta]|eukprot:Sro1506_g278300.1 Receptor-type guanylate cyclase gcy (793) ;mRNA; r:18875-21828